MSSKLLLAFFVGISPVVAQERERDSKSMVTARVTDRENTPIAGAEVYKLDWFGDSKDKPVSALTDAQGVFESQIDVEAPLHTNYVVIHRPGFGFGALCLDVLPARARLHPGRSIAIRILDPQGRNVKDARVMPGEVAFDDEFLHAMVPQALAQKVSAVTRDDGWATLRSMRPSTLRSLLVEAKGYGTQIFPCDFKNETTFHKLQLNETATVELSLLKGDAPATGWKVICRVSDKDRFQAQKKNPEEVVPAIGVLQDKVVDTSGRVVLEHVLAGQDIELTLIDSSNEYRGQSNVQWENVGQVPTVMQVPRSLEDVGQAKHCQVVDVQSGKPVAGFRLNFVNRTLPNMQYDAISDDQGMLSLKLIPGDWHVQVEKAAPGYCSSIISPITVVAKNEVDEKLRNIQVAKGKEITGVIRGISLDLHRARWIHVQWTKGDQESGEVYGTVHPDATFHATIPEFATASDFSIAGRLEHNGQLRVESQEPLVLTGE